MVSVTISEQAQNDPRKQFIEDFNMAFATCDTDYILSCFAEDAHWEMVGAESWTGKAAIAETLKTMSEGDASEIIIHSIISSGNTCASNGVLRYTEGKAVAYCDVYTFTSDAPDAKIRSLTAYAIES